MENQLNQGNDIANQEKDERLAAKVANRIMRFIAGVILGVVMVKLF